MKLEDECLEHDVIYDFSYVPHEALLALGRYPHVCLVDQSYTSRIRSCWHVDKYSVQKVASAAMLAAD